MSVKPTLDKITAQLMLFFYGAGIGYLIEQNSDTLAQQHFAVTNGIGVAIMLSGIALFLTKNNDGADNLMGDIKYISPAILGGVTYLTSYYILR